MEKLFKDIQEGQLFLYQDRVFTKVENMIRQPNGTSTGTNAYDRKADRHVGIGSHAEVEELCSHHMCRHQGKMHFHRINIWEKDDAQVFKTYMV